MNISQFIAKKIYSGKEKTFTSIIVKIAIAAIALSLSIMLITTAVINGFKNQISSKIISFWGDIHVNDTNINRAYDQIPIEDAYNIMQNIDSIAFLDYEDTRQIFGIEIEGNRILSRTKGGVKHVHGTAMLAGLMRTKEKLKNAIMLKGVGQDFDWETIDDFILRGRRISFENEKSSRDILISQSIADRLQLDTNSRVNVSVIQGENHVSRAFRVCGIYSTGLEEYDIKFALVDIRLVRELLGWQNDEVGNIEIALDYKEDAEIVAEYIYINILPPQLYASTIQEKFRSIFEWLKLQEINETIILALMIVVGIINMLSVLLILILERTNMIGILKALGGNNWFIRKIFIYNAAYIIGFGLLIGNIVGLGICFLQKKTGFISLDEKNYYLSTAPIDLDLSTIFFINVSSFFIILLIMIIPTILITYISPIKVLRFE